MAKEKPKNLDQLRIEEFSTPLGTMRAKWNPEGALQSLAFLEKEFVAGSVSQNPSENPSEIARQISEYFRGERRDFSLKLDPEGTPFQKQVWAELLRIPAGEKISYAELARRLGNPKAIRAVGRANALNPICLIVPCHRVVGSSGALTGYAFGLERKARLLALEADNPLFSQGERP